MKSTPAALYDRIKRGPGVFIIGEAGVNHNGDLGMACRLIDAAAAAGCDAVKFQTFKTERVISTRAPKARYQKEATGIGESQFEMVKRLELDAAAHRKLLIHCRKRGILFLSTPFDEESADMLQELGVPLFKIPSGEITNMPLLRHISLKLRPVILSTGMSTLVEVESAVKVLRKAGCVRLVLLHCVTSYPCPIEQVNLRAMTTLARAFKCPVGYSDHTLGLDASLAAVAMGARVIEKHFTMDIGLPGPDHQASLPPEGLAELVERVRALERAMGDGIKRAATCEVENIMIARKSVVAARDIAVGEKIALGDVVIKRPGTGIAPGDIRKVVGRTMSRALGRDEVITWKDTR
ncbi:MAG: N-acetylneuraminate synthase [Candidatus Omnitrophica bacterium]|nr:N-acetylneuraminate synthase [Candidatus Omnitrophota bacterium]